MNLIAISKFLSLWFLTYQPQGAQSFKAISPHSHVQKFRLSDESLHKTYQNLDILDSEKMNQCKEHQQFSAELQSQHSPQDNSIIKKIFKMNSNEFSKDFLAQVYLYEYAKFQKSNLEKLMLHIFKILNHEQDHLEHSYIATVKGDSLEEFSKNVFNKMQGRKISHVGELADLTRARLNFKNIYEAHTALLTTIEEISNFNFKINSITKPKRPLKISTEESGFGYPRFHLRIQDTDSHYICELQFGTLALNDFLDHNNIPLDYDIQKWLNNLNLEANLHDIEYKLFGHYINRFSCEAPSPLIYEIKNFRTKLDKFSAELGIHGYMVNNFEERSKNIYYEAAYLLEKIYLEGKFQLSY